MTTVNSVTATNVTNLTEELEETKKTQETAEETTEYGVAQKTSDDELLSTELDDDISISIVDLNAISQLKLAEDEDKTLTENQDLLKQYEEDREDLIKIAEKIEEKVKVLSDNIEKELASAVKEQKEITEEEEERINDVVEQAIKDFKEAKENGEDVTLSDFQANLEKGMKAGNFDDEMSAIVAQFVATNSKMVQMDSLLGQLGNISTAIKELDVEIADLNDVIDSQTAAATTTTATTSTGCCDPIGFETDDGIKYEFVVDEDNNNALTNFSEFLGAESQFDEMKALDTDGSGDVSAEEMEAAGVKVLVTDTKTGTQELKDVSETLGDNLSVNLESYSEAAQGATASNGQELLGNFTIDNVEIGEAQAASYQGYSTLDTEDYLLENYTFTDEDPTLSSSTIADDVAAIDEFKTTYEAKLAEYETTFDTVAQSLFKDEELINTIKEAAEVSGKSEAKAVIKEAEEEIEAQKAKEAEEAEETEEADDAEEVDEEDEIKKEEEETEEAA